MFIRLSDCSKRVQRKIQTFFEIYTQYSTLTQDFDYIYLLLQLCILYYPLLNLPIDFPLFFFAMFSGEKSCQHFPNVYILIITQLCIHVCLCSCYPSTQLIKATTSEDPTFVLASHTHSLRTLLLPRVDSFGACLVNDTDTNR